ncbi:unnamed protein product [Lampetra fluviatilis]
MRGLAKRWITHPAWRRAGVRMNPQKSMTSRINGGGGGTRSMRGCPGGSGFAGDPFEAAGFIFVAAVTNDPRTCEHARLIRPTTPQLLPWSPYGRATRPGMYRVSVKLRD